MNEANDLEKMKLLVLRSKLIHEMICKLHDIVREFIEKEDVKVLNQEIQVSVIYSAFLSLWTHYKFYEIMAVPYDPKLVEEAQEIVKLEDQFKRSDGGVDHGKSIS